MDSPFIQCQPDTEAWTRARKLLALNGSDISSVCGRGYDSMRYVFNVKLGVKERKISAMLQEIFDRGHALEPEAKEALSELLTCGAIVNAPGIFCLVEFGRYNDRYLVGTTPDGFVLNAKDGVLEPIEIKCPLDTNTVSYGSKKWINYRIQLEAHMRATGAKTGHMFVYHPEQKSLYWKCTRDDYLWKKLVVPCVDIYLGHYLTGLTPAPQDRRRDKWERWILRKCEHKKQLPDDFEMDD